MGDETNKPLVTTSDTALPAPDLLNLKQAAARLNMHPDSVKNMIRRKRIRRIPGFHAILIPRTEIERFCKAL